MISDKEILLAARSALSEFPLNAVKVESVSHSENHVFYVEGDDGNAYVLRIHRPEYHSLAELQSEQVWTQALLEDGIDVPVVVKTRNGDGYTKVAFGEEERYAGMLEWVRGEPLSAQMHRSRDPADRLRKFSTLGGLIATLHEQASNWRVPDEFARHHLDVDGFTGERPFWGRFWEAPSLSAAERANLVTFRNQIRTVLQCFSGQCDAYSLIHADLHAHNVIVSGERLHIIDFDDSGFGWHAYDLAVALYHERHSKDFGAVQQALIEGYSQMRDIDEFTVASIPLFFIVRSLASIGWITARPDLDRDPKPRCEELYSDARANISAAIATSGL